MLFIRTPSKVLRNVPRGIQELPVSFYHLPLQYLVRRCTSKVAVSHGSCGPYRHPSDHRTFAKYCNDQCTKRFRCSRYTQILFLASTGIQHKGISHTSRRKQHDLTQSMLVRPQSWRMCSNRDRIAQAHSQAYHDQSGGGWWTNFSCQV